MANKVLPAVFYYFFVWGEPIATWAGAFMTFLQTSDYYADSLGLASARLTGPSATSIMIIHQLGNCYALIASISFFVLPRIAAMPVSAGHTLRILQVYFGILAFFDITHIGWTIADMGPAKYQIRSWTTLMHGNTSIVIVLFAVRLAWFWQTQCIATTARSSGKARQR